jgi:hypothetical protein
MEEIFIQKNQKKWVEIATTATFTTATLTITATATASNIKINIPYENTLTLLELIIFAHSRDVVAVCLVVGLVDESNVVGSVHEMAVDAVLRCVQLQSIKKRRGRKKGNWRENSRREK